MNISAFWANLTIDVPLIAILAFGSVLLTPFEPPAFFKMCMMNIYAFLNESHYTRATDSYIRFRWRSFNVVRVAHFFKMCIMNILKKGAALSCIKKSIGIWKLEEKPTYFKMCMMNILKFTTNKGAGERDLYPTPLLLCKLVQVVLWIRKFWIRLFLENICYNIVKLVFFRIISKNIICKFFLCCI